MGDDLESTLHFGIFDQENILGVASFFLNNHPSLAHTKQYQLRGMAVLKPFQGKGLGQLILQHGEAILKHNQTDIIWCNARKIALEFYKKNDYQNSGEPFEIKDIGVHYMMYKPL